MKPVTIVALLVTATALQACTHEEQRHANAIVATLTGAPPPADTDLGSLVIPEPEATAPPIAVAETIPEPPRPEYELYDADPTGYTCTPIFRVLSCLDDGRPVYLDDQMGQLPFGVKP
jgi:hypothetical protein